MCCEEMATNTATIQYYTRIVSQRYNMHILHTYLVVRFLELALEVRHDGSDCTYNGDQQGPEGHSSQVMHDCGADRLRVAIEE